MRLCERDTTHVRLTEQGKLLLRKAKEVMQQIEQTVEEIQGMAVPEKRASLKLGYPGWSNHPFISEAVETYQNNFPETEVVLAATDINLDAPQVQQVEEDRLHVGFIRDIKPHQTKSIDYLPIEETPACALMAPKHPLAMARQITLAEVAKYPLLHELNYCHVSHVHSLLRKKQIKPASFTVISGMNTWLVKLLNGLGVSIMQKNQTLAMLVGLVCRPIQDVTWAQGYVIWKKGEDRPHVSSFVEQLRRMQADKRAS